MPKVPNSQPLDSPRCDPRLPEAALAFRRTHSPPLTSLDSLRAINITAWLYRDTDGRERIQVNPNTPIGQLREVPQREDEPGVEIGIHSEGKAAEWFRVRPRVQVLAIFTERIPCPMMCAPLLRHYYPGVPWYYYYDRRSWLQGGRLLRTAAQVLQSAYGL